MAVNIGIKDGDRKAVGEILNRVLSDEFTLYTKTRSYHWNVVGWPFNDLHKFFEAQYEELVEARREVELAGIREALDDVKAGRARRVTAQQLIEESGLDRDA